MIHVTSVTVSPKNVKIKPGEWYENLNATVLPANADKPFVAWTSSNENVVSVSSFSGAVYGMGLGTAVVYATSIDGTNITDCCTFTVTNNIPITNLALDKTSLSMQLNENRTLSATFLPANATNKALTWCSDNTNVVTVNNGTLSPVSTGNAVITAYTTDGSNLSASCAVNVTTNTLVRCITVSDETLSLAVGKSKYITAEVCPTNATNTCVVWTSANPDIATVNPTSGLISALSDGHTTITATAADGSGVIGSCQLTVFTHVPIERISIASTKAVDAGDTFIIPVTICPLNATDNEIIWSSNNTEVVQIDSSTGEIHARNAGIANITAKSKSNPSITATCELWVRGKKAVFLIHGRTSNSAAVWGAVNNIFYNISEFENYQFCPYLDDTTNGKSYIDVESQEICNQIRDLKVDNVNISNYELESIFNGTFTDGKYTTTESSECANLAYKLKDWGYEANVNLFIFNYPNIDAVIHSAEKFHEYICNLAHHISTVGTDKMKTCFYTSRQSYDNNHYSFNIVAHSMGGLVSRYYIENLGKHSHVEKLITICTPHWGSAMADVSNETVLFHEPCDHDLDTESAMFGGTSAPISNHACFGSLTPYLLTPELYYNNYRFTQYYAIAGINCDIIIEDGNNKEFEISSTTTSFDELANELHNHNIRFVEIIGKSPSEAIKLINDNLVSFLSQIGWSDGSESPTKMIDMRKICVLVDKGYTILNRLHNAVPKRINIIQKIYEYLNND